MNWYKLSAVRDTLRLDHGAELEPSVIREHAPNLEVWKRKVGEHQFTTFLNCENDEFLVPEEQLLVAAEHLRIMPAVKFTQRVKARGGLWLGPPPSEEP